MTPPESENPILTHYVLDELPPAQRESVENWVEQNPSAQTELDDLQEVVESLRATAPVHEHRLTPSQRARVLLPPPARRSTLPSRPLRRTPGPGVLSSLLRVAALVALLAAAYALGRKAEDMHSPAKVQTAENTLPNPSKATQSPDSPASQKVDPSLPAAPAFSEAARQEPVVASTPGTATEGTAPAVAAAAPAVKPEPALADARDTTTTTFVGKAPEAAKTADSSRTPSLGITQVGTAPEFVNASRQAMDRSFVQPGLVRPEAATNSRQLQAKPLAANEPKNPADSEPRRKPDLHIHAWSYETASCPWNPRHRLLRVNIQLPADQEAVALGRNEYPVEVQFDANNVREFRRICTRYVPAVEVRSAGSQTIWFEYLPNGLPAASQENGKLVATVRLPSANFTTQTVGPFDSSRLQVLDRGRGWRDARGDFLFDAAVVSLSLLLEGFVAEGGLNHRIVLDLAEAAKAAGDPDGSRARFIQSLRQLGRLTGA